MAVTIIKDNVPALLQSIEDLCKTDILVGVPGDTPARKPSGGHSTKMNNATLAYIHEFGSPAANIPARPFLRPGIQQAMPRIIDRLRSGAVKAITAGMKGDREAGKRSLEAVGLIAQNAVRAYLNAGVNPPLAMSTLLQRQANRPGRKGPGQELSRRRAGGLPGVDLVKPLIDTGQLRNSITYVLRPRSGR